MATPDFTNSFNVEYLKFEPEHRERIAAALAAAKVVITPETSGEEAADIFYDFIVSELEQDFDFDLKVFEDEISEETGWLLAPAPVFVDGDDCPVCQEGG